VLDAVEAGVLIGDLLHGSTAGWIGFDVDALRIGGQVSDQIGSVQVVVGEEDVGDAAVGLAADRDAVGAIKLVTGDGDVGCCGTVGLDRDSVVSGLNDGVDDGGVGNAVDVDAVGIGAGGRSENSDTPDGCAVATLDVEVRVCRLLEGDVVRDEVVRVGRLDDTRRAAGEDVSAPIDDSGP